MFCVCVFTLIVIVNSASGQNFENKTNYSITKNVADVFQHTTENVGILFEEDIDDNKENQNVTVDLESRFGKARKNSNRREKKECVLDVINPDYEKYLPVPLSKDSLDLYEEIVPHQGNIILKVGQEIKFICAGSRNTLKLAPRSDIHTATCVRDSTLKLNNKNQNISKFECSHIVKGEAKATQRSCGDKSGDYFEIGHKITREDFVKLIGVCYDNHNQIALYAEHTVHGTEIKYASKSSYRPSFSTEGIRTNSKFNPQNAYKMESQKNAFKNQLGLDVIDEKQFLARGHLAPDSDFLLATSQYSTFFYLNVAPMWQSINNRNWKILENTVRSAASTYQELKIITGTFEQLTLKDQNNNEVPIFLSENVLPVPKYFWKIVQDPSSQRAIAFIVFNNPFLQEEPRSLFCDDICAVSGWLNPSWRKIDSGYVFCCDAKQFLSVVSTTPKLTVRGVLGGPNY